MAEHRVKRWAGTVWACRRDPMTTADRDDIQAAMKQALVEARILRDTLDTQEALARAWDQGHAYCICNRGDKRCRCPYREATS